MNVFRELAAERLRDAGWIQGALHRPGVGYSIRGAINAVTSGSSHATSATTLRVLAELETDLGMSLDEWNEAKGRTIDDVLSLLTRGTNGRRER